MTPTRGVREIHIYLTVKNKQKSIVGEGFNPPGQLKTVLRLVSTVAGGVNPSPTTHRNKALNPSLEFWPMRGFIECEAHMDGYANIDDPTGINIDYLKVSGDLKLAEASGM